MRGVTSRGVRISYDVVGDGRPLMLLHGFGGDRSWWTEPGYVADLRRSHRLVIVDFPGHGASDQPHEAAAYSTDALIGDVLAIADAEAVDRFAIWGMSYGGWSVDDRGRGPGADPGDRDLGSLGSAIR